MKPAKFSHLKNLIGGCPRRSLFYLNNIRGHPQYYRWKKRYTSDQIQKHIAIAFDIESNENREYPDMFIERLKKEDSGEIINNLEGLINEHDIEIEVTNRKIIYEMSDGTKVQLKVDAIGKFEGSNAIFKIVQTSKFSREYALELVTAQEVLDIENPRLIVLKLGNKDIREIDKNGDRNKDGSLSKRRGALGPWESVKKETNEMLREGMEIMNDMKENPSKYNSPMFGSCITCPYHNYTVEYDGKEITCSG